MYISQIELSSTIIARLSTTVKWILADVRQGERNAINVKLDTGHSTRYPLELSNLRAGKRACLWNDAMECKVNKDIRNENG